MSTKTSSLPDGWKLQSADWHFDKLVEFTLLKQRIGEPSPHLTVVGYLCRKLSLLDRVWLIGCYASTYCLPSGQVIFGQWSHQDIINNPDELMSWLKSNFKGIVTRTERRCVRSPEKMHKCLVSYANWMVAEFPELQRMATIIKDPHEYYDYTWDSAHKIWSFGRYIVIRMIEGLKRYCGIPAELYDLRSIGGWSPKKCLCYLYPQHAEVLLKDDKVGNELTDQLFEDLLHRMRKQLPLLNHYVLAAMLCEYKGAFEKRHQYVGWTIDQEPLLYDKVIAYWGDVIDVEELWDARSNSFPDIVLGEKNGWNGTRWELAKTLRDHGYNWADERYDYQATLKSGDFSKPVRRSNGRSKK